VVSEFVGSSCPKCARTWNSPRDFFRLLFEEEPAVSSDGECGSSLVVRIRCLHCWRESRIPFDFTPETGSGAGGRDD
jgi:hypothetical protein